MEDNKFAQHIYFDRPREGAPSFVKGRMSMKKEDAIKYLQTLEASDRGYVYFDLLTSKDNSKLYFKLNEFKPTPKVDEATADAIFNGGASELTAQDVPPF